MHHNLPSRLTSFVGREHEIGELSALVAARRLVTLVGAPGVGKSRLSLQIAAGLLDRFPDGVWLVELAPLTDPALVAQTVADVLGVREQPSQPLTASLVDWLRSRRLLLLLDNCEHLIGGAAALADALLPACPGLHILATSREPLAIEGEVTRRVPSLGVPEPTTLRSADTDALAALAETDAVRLFVQRAQAVDPAFEVNLRTAQAVIQICARLDGIPLALELAAARIRALSVEQIAARLNDRFRLLTGGNRTALPRQQTLLGAVDWSHDLLSEAEQRTLRRLAVFAGGFTLEAVEAVCAETSSGSSVLGILVSLVDKSLVQADDGTDGARRYRLLETFREYGVAKLTEHGELDRARNRHRDYFLTLAEEAEPRLTGREPELTLAQLELEHDNFRAALAWCIEAAATHPGEGGPQAPDASSSAAEACARLAGALWLFWWLRGHLDEGRRWLDRVLALPSRTDATPSERSGRARARLGAGNLAGYQFDLDSAVRHVEDAVALSQSAGDDRSASQALQLLALCRAYQGEHDLAHRLSDEGVELARRSGDPYSLAMALYGSARIARFLDEHDRNVMFCEESLMLFRALGDVVMTAYTLRTLGIGVYRGLQDRARAEALLEEALRLSREIRDRRGEGESYQLLGSISLTDGDLDQAVERLRAAISILIETGDRALTTWSLFRLAEARTKQGDCAVRGQVIDRPLGVIERAYFLDAVRLFAAVDVTRRQPGLGPLHQMDREYDRLLPILREHLGESQFSQAWAEGHGMSFEQVVAYALQTTRPEATAEAREAIEVDPSPQDAQLAQLTPREREVAALVARGLANREIAAELTLAPRTVETHVHNILGKLELTSRAQLAVWAVEHGLTAARRP
jgi:predicted ATPase/DNA-binding CsgD family transcriptional regulator